MAEIIETIAGLLNTTIYPRESADPAEAVADFLLDSGVRLPVRCGECKNYDIETAWCKIHSCFINGNGDFCHPWESHDWKMFDGAYYCADGERRAE